MCATCGCSEGAKATVTNLATGEKIIVADHDHLHAHGHDHHHHNHNHNHDHNHDHDHHAHEHGIPATVTFEQAVLQKNDALAARNRAWFEGREILALNLVSSPGAGKTTLLERTIRDLKDRHALFVIEGDQTTTHDGERIHAAGAPVVQINTGSGCHLDADMVARGVGELKPAVGSVVVIENVGNLICPALFDLGERAKVAILSVTEGEDKPLKYPHMFQASQVVLLNKIDLLPHLEFDIDRCIANARKVNSKIEVIQVSASTGEGLKSWYDWIDAEWWRVRDQAYGSAEQRI
jgi:hydrogenase nickel incorporation protein HypB